MFMQFKIHYSLIFISDLSTKESTTSLHHKLEFSWYLTLSTLCSVYLCDYSKILVPMDALKTHFWKEKSVAGWYLIKAFTLRRLIFAAKHNVPRVPPEIYVVCLYYLTLMLLITPRAT